MNHRRPPRALAACAVLLAALIGAASASAFAPAPVPCSYIGHGKHQCYFYPAGNGFSAGAPVRSSSGARVGFLNHGDNWVICQSKGARVGTSSVYNHWWAWTEANDGKWGWVSAYYGRGGANDGDFAGVGACGTAHGYPPGGAPPVRKPPTTPAAVPCRHTAAQEYTCSFYTAGDGVSAGTQVEAANRSLVGYLNVGRNWVVCQVVGGEVTVGRSHNHWWAFTEADNGRWGWVNAVYASGGANDGRFGGVPGCGGAHGRAPAGPVVGSPPPGGGGSVPPPGVGTPNGIPRVYIPMYKLTAGYYHLNWLLVASIHAQETNFSRSRLPGVVSGVNFAGCCAGPTQFSIYGARTWYSYWHTYRLFAKHRPRRYPLQSGVTVCLPGGGHPCVYDDFDAIMATGHLLHDLGANRYLAGASWTAAEHYFGGNGPDAVAYANSVITRARAWAAGRAGDSRFGNVVYRDAGIEVSGEAIRASGAADAVSAARRVQPRRTFLIRYTGRLAAAERDFAAFVRAYGYTQPGRLYVVRYAHVRHLGALRELGPAR